MFENYINVFSKKKIILITISFTDRLGVHVSYSVYGATDIDKSIHIDFLPPNYVMKIAACVTPNN